LGAFSGGNEEDRLIRAIDLRRSWIPGGSRIRYPLLHDDNRGQAWRRWWGIPASRSCRQGIGRAATPPRRGTCIDLAAGAGTAVGLSSGSRGTTPSAAGAWATGAAATARRRSFSPGGARAPEGAGSHAARRRRGADGEEGRGGHAVELGPASGAEQRGWEALRAIGWTIQRPRSRPVRAAAPEKQAAFKICSPKPSPRRPRAIPARRSRPSQRRCSRAATGRGGGDLRDGPADAGRPGAPRKRRRARGPGELVVARRRPRLTPEQNAGPAAWVEAGPDPGRDGRCAGGGST
jgi:hypothetical protein